MGRVKRKRSRRKCCAGALAERIDKAQEDLGRKDSFLGSKAHPGNRRGIKCAGPQNRWSLRKGIVRSGDANVARHRGARNLPAWRR